MAAGDYDDNNYTMRYNQYTWRQTADNRYSYGAHNQEGAQQMVNVTVVPMNSGTVNAPTRWAGTNTDPAWSAWTAQERQIRWVSAFDWPDEDETIAVNSITIDVPRPRVLVTRTVRPDLRGVEFHARCDYTIRENSYVVSNEMEENMRSRDELWQYLRSQFAAELLVDEDQIEFETEHQANWRQRREEAERRRYELEREEIRQREEKKRLADERALALLQSVLNEDQKKAFAYAGYIPVVGQSGRHYRVFKQQDPNVTEVTRGGKRLQRWCAAPSDRTLPIYDKLAAQVLFLQYDEKKFLSVANKHPL